MDSSPPPMSATVGPSGRGGLTSVRTLAAPADVSKIVRYLSALPDAVDTLKGDDFWYASVPLCVLDAVFSINARYESVRAVVLRYCAAFNLPVQRARHTLPEPGSQLRVSDLMEQISAVGSARFAAEILCNRARTSTVNGVLKAEACHQFATVLRDHKVEVLQDLVFRDGDQQLVSDLQSVKGQSSGVAVRYFFMLTGADHLIKPDRMILRFLARLLSRQVDGAEAQELLSAAAEQLREDHPDVTAQAIDFAIWSRERVRGASQGGSPGLDLPR